MKFLVAVAIVFAAVVSASPVNMPRAAFTKQNGIDAKNLKYVRTAHSSLLDCYVLIRWMPLQRPIRNFDSQLALYLGYERVRGH